MFDTDGIYAPGPIKPVAKIKENLAIWTSGVWKHYRIEHIEPMPRSAPLVAEMVTLSLATTLAAGGTIARRLLPILQLNLGEFLHLRWEPLDNVEGVLWEVSGQGRFISRGAQARVDRNTKTYDPYLATTTFWIIGGLERDMNLEVRNPMSYATPVARFAFWGYRYNLTDLTVGMSDVDKKALAAGDLEGVKRLIGATTWLPAEGRVA